MLYKKILIPTDGKKPSEDIIDFICAIQGITQSEITVIYVIEVPRNLPLHAEVPEKIEAARLAIDTANKIAAKYGVNISTSIIYSRTAEDSILFTAEDLKADVIAIAQDNHKLRIFANTASSIYQRSKCSVWLFNSKV
ncbi:MAG: universal stress protein [Bacillota bacterium]|nr:universal stress protein [Bacillota bacterium]